MIKYYFNLIFYYALVLIGLIITSWIIWSRFIRERTIREIPDYLFTEYRFWILLYLCAIYLNIIKNLYKPSDTDPAVNSSIKEIIAILYKPLTILDHLIKYNQYVKPYYYALMFKVAEFVSIENVTDNKLRFVIFSMQIVPRMILISFLFMDTFYFHKLEIFYKVILIGILPFLLRYIKYSIKDIYEYWILELEDHYSSVHIYEKGYKFDESRKLCTKAVYHCQNISIREYIEIKHDNILDYWSNDDDLQNAYEYESSPYLKENILNKYRGPKQYITAKELDKEEKLYYKLMPKIMHLKVHFTNFEEINNTPLIKNFKIFIFSIYLICWGYVLCCCYYHNPIEFVMGKYLLKNCLIYLILESNPFYELCGYHYDKELLYTIIRNILKIK